MLKKVVSLITIGVIIALTGCTTKMIPAEDPKVVTMFAKEVSVLQDPYLPSNSKEKYEAAKALAKKVDFSYVRNVKTLETIFLPADAMRNPNGTEVAFYYPYRENSVRFRFFRHGNTVIKVEVTTK